MCLFGYVGCRVCDLHCFFYFAHSEWDNEQCVHVLIIACHLHVTVGNSCGCPEGRAFYRLLVSQSVAVVAGTNYATNALAL
jgi:hypothetical protein